MVTVHGPDGSNEGLVVCGHVFWQKPQKITATRLHIENYPGSAGVSPAVATQRTVGTILPMDVLDTSLDLNVTITGCTPIGRGNKFGQASVVRVSITNHSRNRSRVK